VSFRYNFDDAASGDAIIESSSRQSRICIVTIRNGTRMFAATERVPDAILAPRVFPDSFEIVKISIYRIPGIRAVCAQSDLSGATIDET